MAQHRSSLAGCLQETCQRRAWKDRLQTLLKIKTALLFFLTDHAFLNLCLHFFLKEDEYVQSFFFSFFFSIFFHFISSFRRVKKIFTSVDTCNNTSSYLTECLLCVRPLIFVTEPYRAGRAPLQLRVRENK